MKQKKEKVQKAKDGLVVIKKAGVNINAPAIKDAKTEEDLRKLNLFSHLTEKDQDEAYKDLAEIVLAPGE